MQPVKFGLAGLGGYAGTICRLLMNQTLNENPSVQLSAVCDPDLEAHSDLVSELRTMGVIVLPGWADLLSLPIEAVWLPLPIPLHRPYTEQALLAGKAVLCEKPAAGSVQDLVAMRAARDRAGLPVAIAFQDIYKPSTLALKRLILEGSIGHIQSATLTACWPRDSSYYSRSSWPGRQMQEGAWVMDSPASNALAHFLNLALFLLGENEGSVELARVEAELYRVNPIENYDTCALRLHMQTGASLLVCFTHACRESRQPRLVINGERGKILYEASQDAIVERNQSRETISLRGESHDAMIQRFAHLVRGITDDRAVATLETSRTHLVAVNGASEAAPVSTIPSSHIVSVDNGAQLLTIPGIEDLFDRCAQQHMLPHETGLAPWTQPAGERDLRNYNVFAGPMGGPVKV